MNFQNSLDQVLVTTVHVVLKYHKREKTFGGGKKEKLSAVLYPHSPFKKVLEKK